MIIKSLDKALLLLCRSAIIKDELANLLPRLQAELDRTEETGMNIVVEGVKQFTKLKADVSQWLDTVYAQEKRRVVSANIRNRTFKLSYNQSDLADLLPI